MLVCTEAGAVVDELGGMDLVTLDHEDRRTPGGRVDARTARGAPVPRRRQ